MVVLVIFVIVIGAVFAVEYAGRSSWKQQEAQLRAQQELRKALERIVTDLRQTRSTFLSSLNPAVPPDGAMHAAAAFRVPQDADNDGDVVDDSGTMEWSNIISYSMGGTNNSQLLRRVLDDAGNVLSSEVVANSITQLGFTRTATAPNNIQVSCTFQRQEPGGQAATITSTVDVYIRN